MLRKRSVTIAGHRTSISLEDEFWSELVRIAADHKTSLNSLISNIDEARATNLSSAIRLHVLEDLKKVRETVC
ncbi:MAG: ribbon-helix-helix domain-containing protein [Flavobacteriales bacterium]|nr:ribbon-helix-helix domain-containing protein [Flavobacteriales bacterium]